VTGARVGAPQVRSARGWFIGERPDFRVRGLWLVLGFGAMAIAVLGRLVQVQLLDGGWLSARAAAEQTTSITLPGHRGDILDREGRVLVSNQTVYDVFADPSLIDVSQRAQVADEVANVLKLSRGTVEQALQRRTQFVYLARAQPAGVNARLKALDLAGIGTIPSQRRVYEPSPVPGLSFAANLLGFVNADAQGQYGVEGFYDQRLRGTDGHESTVVDLLGNAIILGKQEKTTARDGDDIQLGLDSQIQYWAELALAKGVQNAEAASGTLMIMDTHTGSIRAWAQYPSYNANDYGSSSLTSFRDLAVSDPYEPGSVLKVVTFAGGLDHHVITPQTVIDERQSVVDGVLIHDWDNRSHGMVSMQTVLDDSLNNGAIRVMQLEGHDAFYANLLGFGIGAPTGVDLSGEVNRPLRPQQSWRELSYAEASFGQAVVATPVEMLAALNTVANGGVWVQPHAVDAVVDPATGTRTPVVPLSRRVMPADSAATLAHMLVGVVDDRGAEGFMAKIPGYIGEIAGKTGTASVAVHGRYGGDVIASFMGFMPVQNPQFTMMVILRYPHENRVPRFGALLAAPVWSDVARIIIDQWRITP
jgi:cell division protein FtsI/penicillin-binding protein 2